MNAMDDLLNHILLCVENGKVNKLAPYPDQMKDQNGADECTKIALESGIKAEDILNLALIPAMEKVGQKFSEKKIFIPQMLMAAKAMTASLEQLKPYFTSGEIKQKGTVVLATVQGDLHDIGKNLVKMTIEGSGWNVVDLGVDVRAERIIESLQTNPGAVVGLSALLTTTMSNMGQIVNDVKIKLPGTKVMIGGAPVTQDFCNKIGADFYSPDPQGAVVYLNKTIQLNTK
jgi:methanogenic corrinoid protein MtbC1